MKTEVQLDICQIFPPQLPVRLRLSQSVAGGWWLYNLAWSAGGLQECGFHVADCLSAYVQYYFHHNHHHHKNMFPRTGPTGTVSRDREGQIIKFKYQI